MIDRKNVLFSLQSRKKDVNSNLSEHMLTDALSICPDKIFFVLDKIRFVLDKIILSMKKYFCPRQKFCPQLKYHFCFEKTCLKPWTKFLSRTKNILSWTKSICLGQIWFCPGQKIFCPGRWTGHKRQKIWYTWYSWGDLFNASRQNFVRKCQNSGSKKPNDNKQMEF